MSKLFGFCLEGNCEEALIQVLIDKGLLLINETNIINPGKYQIRKGDRFEKLLLEFDFEEQNIVIIRILDSVKEKFKLSAAMSDKVEVKNYYTRPEIEMLYIIGENKYADYDRKNLKVREYISKVMKIKYPKNFDTMYKYLNKKNNDEIIQLLHEYHRIKCQGTESCLYCFYEEYKVE